MSIQRIRKSPNQRNELDATVQNLTLSQISVKEHHLLHLNKVSKPNKKRRLKLFCLQKLKSKKYPLNASMRRNFRIKSLNSSKTAHLKLKHVLDKVVILTVVGLMRS